MGLPTLFRALVLIFCAGARVVWADHYHSNEEAEYYYSLYNHHASDTTQPNKHRSTRSHEAVASIPLAESLSFENELPENNVKLFPDRLLTMDELTSEMSGSGDRFPPDLKFIDDGDVMTLHTHNEAMHPLNSENEIKPNEIDDAHIWSGQHESPFHTVTADEVDNFLSSTEEIFQRNLRENTKGTNRRQASPERQMLPVLSAEWLNTASQQTLDFQEKMSAFHKPVFLMQAQIPLQQHLAFVIPGQHGQPSILLPLDKSFTELLSQSVMAEKIPFLISGPVPLLQRPFLRPQEHHQQREEVPPVSPEQSFDANTPSDGLREEKPAQRKQPEKDEGSTATVVNALTSNEQSPLAENSMNNPHFLFENLMMNDDSGLNLDELEFLDAAKEIHFAPGSDLPPSVLPPTKSHLHDQLQRAKVVVAPSNQKNGKHAPIITAIPSVVASSHTLKQRYQVVNDYVSSEAPGTSSSPGPPEYFTIDEPSFSSGSFEEQADFSGHEPLPLSAFNRQKRQLEQFLQAAQRSFTAGEAELTPSMSWRQPITHSTANPVYQASKQEAPVRSAEQSRRQARQDSQVESDRPEQQALVGADGNREIRMSRTKPTPDQRPAATYIKPGYATASFSAVNQEKSPLRSSGQQKVPSRSATRPRSKHSPLMMALLPQPDMHPLSFAAPPQQVPPCRSQPLLPAQQEKSDKVVATAQGEVQQERPQRPVPRQDQWQQADRFLPPEHPCQQEGSSQGRQRNSQGKKKDSGLQDSQHLLPHQIGRQGKGSQTVQGSKDNQGTQTPVMQFSFVAPPQNQIPSVTSTRVSQPKRVSPSGFRPPPPDLASPATTASESALRSTRAVPSIKTAASREQPVHMALERL